MISLSRRCLTLCACGFVLRAIRFYRNTGMEGWKGGSDGTKVMVFEVDMPHCGSEGFSQCTHNRPAVWALNSKASDTTCLLRQKLVAVGAFALGTVAATYVCVSFRAKFRS